MKFSSEREAPDISTASEDYARRFRGPAGGYLLSRQEAAVREVLADWTGGTILDVGGGHAQLLPVFSGPHDRVVVLGSDVSSLDRVKRFPRCARVTGDLLELPFSANSFDLVIAVRLVSHVENWPRLISELCRVARRTVVIDYPRSTGFNALTPILFKVKKRIEGNTRHYRNFADNELDAAFTANSFVSTKRCAQFLLPMVLHRRLGGSYPLRYIEKCAQDAGVTKLLGSPVILRADKKQ